jgi:hypothetical protein
MRLIHLLSLITTFPTSDLVKRLQGKGGDWRFGMQNPIRSFALGSIDGHDDLFTGSPGHRHDSLGERVSTDPCRTRRPWAPCCPCRPGRTRPATLASPVLIRLPSPVHPQRVRGHASEAESNESTPCTRDAHPGGYDAAPAASPMSRYLHRVQCTETGQMWLLAPVKPFSFSPAQQQIFCIIDIACDLSSPSA